MPLSISQSAGVASPKRPPEYVTGRTCNCSQCRNRIYAHNIAAKANGRVICTNCADTAEWSPAYQRWEWKNG